MVPCLPHHVCPITRHQTLLHLALLSLAACPLLCIGHPMFDDTHVPSEGAAAARTLPPRPFPPPPATVANNHSRAEASLRLAAELEQEISDLSDIMKDSDDDSQQHCSSGKDRVDLVISAAMTPPYPYGYGAEYVARCCPRSSFPRAAASARYVDASCDSRGNSGLQGHSEQAVSRVSLLRCSLRCFSSRALRRHRARCVAVA